MAEGNCTDNGGVVSFLRWLNEFAFNELETSGVRDSRGGSTAGTIVVAVK